jgi:hypothetical protein
VEPNNWYQNNYTVIDNRLHLSIDIMNFEGKEGRHMAMIAAYHFFVGYNGSTDSSEGVISWLAVRDQRAIYCIAPKSGTF